MTTERNPSDALPLLACKIAPRQFDLSYRFSSISLRDQIVRAQTLIRALFESKLTLPRAKEVDNEFQLLIVGAGAAGLSAAKEAATLEVSFVLIEKEDDAPGGVLRSSAERYVSTAMYEWPQPNHAEHNFPLAAPHLLGRDHAPPSLSLNFAEPVPVAQFGKILVETLQLDLNKWKTNYGRYIQGEHMLSREIFMKSARLAEQTKQKLQGTLTGQVSIHGIPLNDMGLPLVELEDSQGGSLGSFRFQYVIYAVGFGVETSNYADKKPSYEGYDHRPFWGVDSISTPNLGFSKPPNIGILGSGDGALQDALRCLVDPKWVHPLAIWNGILEWPQDKQPRLKYSRNVDKALARIAAADGYTTAGAIWTDKTYIFESLDQTFKDVVTELVNQGMVSKTRVAKRLEASTASI